LATGGKSVSSGNLVLGLTPIARGALAGPVSLGVLIGNFPPVAAAGVADFGCAAGSTMRIVALSTGSLYDAGTTAESVFVIARAAPLFAATTFDRLSAGTGLMAGVLASDLPALEEPGACHAASCVPSPDVWLLLWGSEVPRGKLADPPLGTAAAGATTGTAPGGE
jgi:hypothetical protein